MNFLQGLLYFGLFCTVGIPILVGVFGIIAWFIESCMENPGNIPLNLTPFLAIGYIVIACMACYDEITSGTPAGKAIGIAVVIGVVILGIWVFISAIISTRVELKYKREGWKQHQEALKKYEYVCKKWRGEAD